MADATTRLSHHALHLGMAGPVVFSGEFLSLLTDTAPDIATGILQVYITGLIGMVATSTLAPTAVKYMHSLAKNSREWSVSEQQRWLGKFRDDLSHMPEKTKRLLAESDPMIFILDSQFHFPGWTAIINLS